mmetsp:Transcript_10597/g.10701  ORF Transcript_10597/g.10701 Transcript_10597/m.10701 type:complete len:86 (-) Transcript_10597:54-311(-)
MFISSGKSLLFIMLEDAESSLVCIWEAEKGDNLVAHLLKNKKGIVFNLFLDIIFGGFPTLLEIVPETLFNTLLELTFGTPTGGGF